MKYCKTHLFQTGDFCGECGKPTFNYPKCPKCFDEISLHDKYCSKCGTKYPENYAGLNSNEKTP